MPFCTICIARYKEPDYLLINNLVHISLLEGISAEVLVIDQSIQENAKIKLLCSTLSNKNIKLNYLYRNDFLNLSSVRNFCLDHAKYPFVLFLDCDAVVQNNWALEICNSLMYPDIGIVWTKILPFWMKTPNFINIHPLFSFVYSLLDIGISEKFTNKVIWASFGLDKNKISERFNTNLWRKKTGFLQLIWWEETDLCFRVINSWYKILYIGSTYVTHYIGANRMTYYFLIKSLFFAGYTRGFIWWIPKPIIKTKKSLLFPINPFVYIFLIFYIFGYGFAFASYLFIRNF